MPDGWIPSWEEIAKAKQIWLHSQKLNEAEKKGHVDQAIEKVQEFIGVVRHYETWKRDGSMPSIPSAPVVAPSVALAQPPILSTPRFPVTDSQRTALEVPQGAPSQRTAVAPSAPFPPCAPAPSSFPAPQSPTNFTHTFGQAPLPPPRPLESFRQPGPAPFLRHEARDDQHSSIMSFRSTPEQQDRNMNQMMEHQTREYHHRMQQTNAQAWQQLRQQQQGPTAAPMPAPTASPTPLSSSESTARPGMTGVGSLTASSLGKRKGDEKDDRHVEKGPRQ